MPLYFMVYDMSEKRASERTRAEKVRDGIISTENKIEWIKHVEMEKFRLLARTINEMTMPMNWIFDVTMHTHTPTCLECMCVCVSERMCIWVDVWVKCVQFQVDVCVLTCGKWHILTQHKHIRRRQWMWAEKESPKNWKTHNNKIWFNKLRKIFCKYYFIFYIHI